jgi:hypothetical protein
MSPVDTWGTAKCSARRTAWVPLPAPWRPSSTRRIPLVIWPLLRGGLGLGLGPGLRLGVVEEALVVAHHQLAVDLLDRLEGHAHGDEDGDAEEAELLPAPRVAQRLADDERRHERDAGHEQGARKRDAAEDLGQVPLGLVAGSDARDEPALLADLVGLLVRIELDRRVEVGEGDDQDAVEGQVEGRRGPHQVVVDPALHAHRPVVVLGRQDLRQHHRQVQHRAGEDDRDHAGPVHLQRDVGALAAEHLAADLALGELHRDAANALLDEHDGDQQQGEHGGHAEHGSQALLGVDRAEVGGELAHHRGEDQDRHAVADAPLGDDLTQPHQQGEAGGEGEHHQGEAPEVVGAGEQVDTQTTAERALTSGVEQVGDARALQEGDRHTHVAGPLGDLALADRALLLPLLQLGDHHAEDLHDDRRRDVRHDPQGEDGELGDGSTGEGGEQTEHTTGLGSQLQVFDDPEVDARHRHVGTEPVDRHHEQGEEQLVAQLRDLEDVAEG